MKRSTIITSLIIILGLSVFAGCFLMSKNKKKKVKEAEPVTTEAPIETGWVTEDDNTLYLNSAGDATKGMAEIDGKMYVFDEDGHLERGWQDPEDEKGNEVSAKYYVNPDGTIAQGWTKINDYTYYFNEDGTPYSGWLTENGKRYYIKKNGQIMTGVSKIDGQYYTFRDDGSIITQEELTEKLAEIPENQDAGSGKKSESDNTIYTFGGYELDFEDKKALLDVINEVDPSDYQTVGFVMINLVNGKGVGYNVDDKVYSASCIKGPYVASLVNYKPELIETNSNTLIQVVMNSDNKLYSGLRKTYGRLFFGEWCVSAGADEDVSVYNYPRLSARNLAKLWIKNYYFFNTDETGIQIRDWYTKPNASAIYSSLGRDETAEAPLGYRTESKAGWFCESGKIDATATTDGGIIYPDDHSAYVIAIITSLPSDMKSLEPLCLELNEIYKKTR